MDSILFCFQMKLMVWVMLWDFSQIGRKAGIIAEPQLTCHVIDDQLDEFLILASDGVWDSLTNDEVIELINERSRTLSSSSPRASPQLPDEASTSSDLSSTSASSLSFSNHHQGESAPSKVVSFDHLDLQELCDVIVTEATQRFIEREDISDDTSIVIVRL
jgi:serine/threonine protein phosphatase PrpC